MTVFCSNSNLVMSHESWLMNHDLPHDCPLAKVAAEIVTSGLIRCFDFTTRPYPHIPTLPRNIRRVPMFLHYEYNYVIIIMDLRVCLCYDLWLISYDSSSWSLKRKAFWNERSSSGRDTDTFVRVSGRNQRSDFAICTRNCKITSVRTSPYLRVHR